MKKIDCINARINLVLLLFLFFSFMKYPWMSRVCEMPLHSITSTATDHRDGWGHTQMNPDKPQWGHLQKPLTQQEVLTNLLKFKNTHLVTQHCLSHSMNIYFLAVKKKQPYNMNEEDCFIVYLTLSNQVFHLLSASICQLLYFIV